MKLSVPASASAFAVLTTAVTAGSALAATTSAPRLTPHPTFPTAGPVQPLGTTLAPGTRLGRLPLRPASSRPRSATAGSPARKRRARLRFPVVGKVGYGEAIARYGVARGGHAHQGQDMFAKPGTPLVAVADGLVLEAGGGDARGNYVAIYDRSRNSTYVYFHMQSPTRLKPGRRVRAGQRVGRVGCTGRCFGPHLHFEVRRGRASSAPSTDPMPLLRRARRR